MELIFYPEKKSWISFCQRPEINKADLEDRVKKIIESVRSDKDKALYSLTEKLEGARLKDIKVSAKEITESGSQVSEDLKRAIKLAKKNIEKFHQSQFTSEAPVETTVGVKCWRKNIAIEKVGLYIPGGSAPLFSSVLMLGIPAKIAGCTDIMLCTPCNSEGKVNPLILYTAHLLGIDDIYKLGGAQAIAAMAYGTESIQKVYKIFGPGNQYVTKAKELIQQDGVAIDMPAGPSEVLVIADDTGNPEFIAADLLSQAEHGPDSQVILVTSSKRIIESVSMEVEKQIETLARKEIAYEALLNSKLILMESLNDCISFSNQYAPEHLIISTAENEKLAVKVVNAGSVFLGNYSCESAGDYASGTNHTLPTNGFARNYSGVSTDSFIKKVTFQEISAAGIMAIGPAIELMAEAESLEGHRNAVSIRIKSLKNV